MDRGEQGMGKTENEDKEQYSRKQAEREVVSEVESCTFKFVRRCSRDRRQSNTEDDGCSARSNAIRVDIFPHPLAGQSTPDNDFG